jgi:predicted hydrocarbon binding protein
MIQQDRGSSRFGAKEVITILFIGLIPVIVPLLLPGEADITLRLVIGFGIFLTLMATVLLFQVWAARKENAARDAERRKQNEELQEQIRQLPHPALTDNNYDSNEGLMFKGTKEEGRVRNAALRTQSIHNLLDTIIANVPKEEREGAMRLAGKKMGETFAETFESMPGELPNSPENLEAKLDLWTDYDASAGLGRLTFKLDSSEVGEGIVELKNGFLQSEFDSNCSMDYVIAGYLEGALERLMGKDLSVQPTQPLTQAHDRSIFRISPRLSIEESKDHNIEESKDHNIEESKDHKKELSTPSPKAAKAP